MSRPASSTLSLARHEMAHALAGLLCGAEEARISEDGDYWKTEHIGLPNDEEIVARTWVAGMLVPECMSPEDRIVISAFPQSLRDAAYDWCVKTVLPHLTEISDAELARVAAKVEDGGIRLRRTRQH